MEHDEKCKEHTEWINTLRERTHTIANTEQATSAEIHNLGLQLADAVSDLHDHSVEFEKLKSSIALLCAKIPEDLVKEFTQVQSKLDTVHLDFTTLRRQVYGVIGAFMIVGVTAFANWIFKGGLFR